MSGHTPAKNPSYYLIRLGYDIVTCDGDAATAYAHLSKIRREHIEATRQATGKNPETVPWLIGIYPHETVGGKEGKGGVYSYGYAPTLRGGIDIPRSEWKRL